MKNNRIFVIAVFFIGIASIADVRSDYQQGYSAGAAAGRQLRSQVDNPDALNERVAQPLTSDGTSMTAFGPRTVAPTNETQCPDGYQYNGTNCELREFNAQIVAPSSAAFLSIDLNAMPTNDLSISNLSQDNDFNQSLNYNYAPGLVVSGICANGLVSCNAGTWQGCRYYRWSSDAQLQLTLNEVPTISNMAGCYCVNSTCGSPLGGNLTKALNDLGGGAVGAIIGVDPRVTITQVETMATNIRYYGQRSSEAGNGFPAASYQSGVANPTVYYAPTSGAALESAGQSEAALQQTNPDSFYTTLVSTNNSVVNSRGEKNCVIIRTVNIDGTNTPVLGTTDTCAGLDITGCTLRTEQLCNYSKSNCVYSIENGASTGQVPGNNTVTRASTTAGAPWGFDATGAQILITAPTAGVLATGPDNWWNIERRYICDAAYDINTKNYPTQDVQPSFLSSQGVEKGDRAQTSTTFANNTAHYEDLDPSTGQVTQRDIQIQPNPPIGRCEKACKLRRDTQKTDVAATANSWEYQNSTDSVTYIFRLCPEGTCQVEPGETIVKNCSCTNEFPEAVSALQAINDAAKDIICSQE